jgi:capsular polysaccharide biosynthesis protein
MTAFSELRKVHHLRHLHQLLDVIARRRIVVIASVIVGLIAMTLCLCNIPKTYEAASRVLIVADSNGRDPSVTSIDLPSVATSTVVLSHVMEDLKLPTELTKMKGSVKARVSARSSIMEIGYRDTQPDRAVAVTNAIADELSRYYETISTSRADSTIAKLDRAIKASEMRLADVGSRIAAESARNPLVQSDHAFESVTARLEDLSTQRRFAQSTLEADVAARSALSPDAAMSRIARFEKLQNDETYKQLAAGSAKDAAELAFTKAAFTNRYPGLPGLATKVAADQSASADRERHTLASPDAFSLTLAANDLQQRKADATIAGDHAKIVAIEALVAATAAHLNDLPAATVAQQRLKLEQDAAKADYLALSGRRTSAVASRAEALSLGSVVVVDRAVRADAAVVGLNGVKLAAVAFALVMGFVGGCTLLAEMLDAHLRRPAQIEKLYGAHYITTLSMES